MAGSAETVKSPRGLAGEYLEEALEALHDTGDAASLFPLWAREGDDLDDLRAAFAHVEAQNRRRRFARRSVLFAALAAEAYVNEFLANYLNGMDLKGVDRLSTVDKYVVGTRLATGTNMFRRDAEPVQTLKVLFKHRDKLVHPKPGYGPPKSASEAARDAEAFTPGQAAKFVLYVAVAATILVRAAKGSVPDMPADVIKLHAKVVADYAARASRRLPDRRAEAEPPLMTQLIRSGSDIRRG